VEEAGVAVVVAVVGGVPIVMPVGVYLRRVEVAVKACGGAGPWLSRSTCHWMRRGMPSWNARLELDLIY